jgi:ketosteroid isomerase-like protein
LTLLAHVQGYYEALNRGDAEEVASFFTADATHYYTRLGPHRGARTIGEHTRMAVEVLQASWTLENGIEDGEQAVIASSCIRLRRRQDLQTMTWTDPKSGQRRLDRGTEWFRFRDGKICEVRAYHHSNDKNRSGDLLGFDHAARGYTTLR